MRVSKLGMKDLTVDGEVIGWFDDLGTGNPEHSFLSNFYEGLPLSLPGVTWGALLDQCSDKQLAQVLELVFKGEQHVDLDLESEKPVWFATGEHAFAALKAWGSDPVAFTRMALADGPGDAKSQGRRCKLRPDWNAVKLDVMAAVVRAKFTLERSEGRRLLRTGDALLVEGTFWGDDVWGVDVSGAKVKGKTRVETSPGRNWLGTLLMARRAELRAEEAFGRATLALESNAETAARGVQRPAWAR